ncbi:MAG: hypothetical protein Q9178_005678 [Gyalolechia marmorata]
MAPYILDTFASNGLRPTIKSLRIIAERLIGSLASVRIIIDGIDETDPSHQKEIIEDLMGLKRSSQDSCKILMSTRRQPLISKLLQMKPTIRMENHADSMDSMISSFVHRKLSGLRQRHRTDTIDQVESQIVKKADGMFLWVKLIMFLLEDVCYASDIKEILETLPAGLPALYERIISVICGSGKSPNQRRAVKIIHWVVAARRPLRRYEIECAMTLEEMRDTFIQEPSGDILGICDPLLDVDDGPTGLVKFCHFTALEYIRDSNFRTLRYPHAGYTCLSGCLSALGLFINLSITPATRETPTPQILHRIHDLLLYAIDHWIDHLDALSDNEAVYGDETKASKELIAEKLITLARVCEGSWIGTVPLSVAGDSNSPPPLQATWRSLNLEPSTVNILNKLCVLNCKSCSTGGFARQNAGSEERNLSPSMLSSRYHEMLERALDLEDPASKDITNFKERRGLGVYLCRHRGCRHSKDGFDSADLRQQHEDSHAPQFQCREVGCGLFGWNLKSRSAMKSHDTKYHVASRLSQIPDRLSKVDTVNSSRVVQFGTDGGILDSYDSGLDPSADVPPIGLDTFFSDNDVEMLRKHCDPFDPEYKQP